MSESDTFFAQLESEYDELQFDRFGFDVAWALGQDLVAVGQRDGLPIAIDISANGQMLFHAGLPGSGPDNDQWLVRKSRVALRFRKSSLHFARALEAKGRSLLEHHGLSPAEYAASGGSFPIKVRTAGVIGTITVSGLPDHEDHRLVVEAIRRYLEREASDRK
jgi:uncharacterized protein (UPF0303 family)